MPRNRTYQCNSCDKTFTFFHHPTDEPAFCPFCGYSEEQHSMRQTLAVPSIGTHKGRGPDNLYRAMEEGAQFRADMAAEMGVDRDTADGLKMTDMRDGLRAGDTSFVPVNNDITRTIEAAPAGPGGQMWGWNTQGASLSPDVRSGPAPNAGMKAMRTIRANHAANAARNGMATAGNAGSLTSSLPAYETMQPGYRR